MFQDRKEAGFLLAEKLKEFKNKKDTLVLAIPRGGVVVGGQIAKILNLPLSLVVVKKLGAPHNPELAIGAITSAGINIIDWELALRLGIEQEYLDKEIQKKRKELKEREKTYNIEHLTNNIKNKKHIILVDDGIATGATTMAAIKYIKEQRTYNKEQNFILAVPVIAKETYVRLKSEVDNIIALEIPDSFNAVGQFYKEFPQVSDEEIVKLL